MSEYKRYYQSGGNYFFTLVTHQRNPILTTPDNIVRLKGAIKKVKHNHPFSLDAIVILPDHLHCILRLPNEDQDFSTRIRLIKRYFSMQIDTSINHRKEKMVWQRRFWEHYIRNEEDWRTHMDYIHYNPVKHGFVRTVKDWQHSSFHYCVEKGFYELNWGSEVPVALTKLNNLE